MKNYNQAPLPFQGQKRRFLKQFKESLNAIKNAETYTFIDLFGGSGLLSHTVKQEYPSARVVWNDYDNYQERLAEVANTNVLLADLRILLAACEEDKRVPENVKQQILKRIAEENGFIDYVTLSASLLFSGKYVTDYTSLQKQTFYNTIKKTDYQTTGYLQDVERVSVDYKLLYEQFKDKDKVLFLIDPPYLSTDCTSYGSDDYWKLGDYLDVLTTLQGSNYFYFTSNKSQVIELCSWMSSQSNYVNPFAGAQTQTTTGSVNYSSNYTDIMVYKVKSDE